MAASSPAPEEAPGGRKAWSDYRRWWGLLLAIATLAAYLPAMNGKFVWDDSAWTTDIPGQLHGLAGLASIWFQPTALQQYYPLTGTTFWMDYQLWGFWTLPYHVENVLLHVFAALLFWKLLCRLEVPGARLAAWVFALHPLMVESAAWITERKNVLSLVLYLGTLLAYDRFAPFAVRKGNEPAAGPGISSGRAYTLSLFLLGGALLAKTTAFSLPAVILLIIWWKRGEIRWRADVRPTLPLFILAAGLSSITFWLETWHVGARGPDWDISFPARCVIAGRVLWFYVAKLLWPAHLCFIYPRWNPDPASLEQWLYPLSAFGVLLALWLARTRIGRGPAAAAFFYAGTLFPVLGFLNTYFMIYSFVCNHWAYLSSLGLIALGAALLTRAAERFRVQRMLWGFAAVLLCALSILTWRQSCMFADSETLWRTTVARNPNCWMAHCNLGSVLLQTGRTDAAIEQFEKTLQIRPRYELAHNDLGIAFQLSGRMDEAIAQYKQALTIKPDFASAYNNLGNALLQNGQWEEAIIQYRKALELEPQNASAHGNLAELLLRQGQVEEALAHFRKAVELQPYDARSRGKLADALMRIGQTHQAIAQYQQALDLSPDSGDLHHRFGSALAQAGQLDAAAAQYQLALKLEPTNAVIHCNLGNVLLRKGLQRQAMMQFQAALKIDPASVESLNNLAWLLATSPEASIRDGLHALALAEQARQLSRGTNPAILDTVAAAYAECARYPEAVVAAEQALRVAQAQNQISMADAIRKQIELFQKGIPFRETGQSNNSARPYSP